MSPKGRLLIGGEALSGPGGVFRGRSAFSGEALEPAFHAATPADLDRACALARDAFDGFRDTTTSDSRSTSVGAQAITRFLGPVCDQDLPEALLPEPVKTANPWGAPRWIDGRYQPA